MDDPKAAAVPNASNLAASAAVTATLPTLRPSAPGATSPAPLTGAAKSDALAVATSGRGGLFNREKRIGLGILTLLFAVFGAVVWWRMYADPRKQGDVAKDIVSRGQATDAAMNAGDESPTIVSPPSSRSSLAESPAPTDVRPRRSSLAHHEHDADDDAHGPLKRSYMPGRERSASAQAASAESEDDDPPSRVARRDNGASDARSLASRYPDDDADDGTPRGTAPKHPSPLRPKVLPLPEDSESEPIVQPTDDERSPAEHAPSKPATLPVRRTSVDVDVAEHPLRTEASAKSSVTSDDAIPAAPRSFQPRQQVSDIAQEPAERIADAPRQEPAATEVVVSDAVRSADSVPRTAAARPAAAVGPVAAHIVQAGENYWTVADRAYGAGDYFRALMAYNKGRLPHVARLQPGDELLIPPAAELRAKFPSLCPPERTARASR